MHKMNKCIFKSENDEKSRSSRSCGLCWSQKQNQTGFSNIIFENVNNKAVSLYDKQDGEVGSIN